MRASMTKTSKIIWITGASSGIGESLAYYLSNQGHKLILSSRREEALKEVRARCKDPEAVAIIPLDLSNPESMPGAVEKAEKCFGEIDILVNNAGLSQRSLIADTKLEVYDRLMRVNYLGTIALTKALLPHFMARGGGKFVTVTSLMGRFGSPWRSGYCAAKHALHGFFDVLRMEHGKDGVEVCLICPGFVQTDVARNALTSDGSPQKSQDQATSKGMPADRFAVKMWKAVESGKWEAYIGGREVSGIYLKRFFPKLLHKVVLRSQVV